MKQIMTPGILTLAMMLAACAVQPAAAPPPLKIITEAAPEPEASPAPPTGAELMARQRSEVREAVKEHQKNGRWPLYKTSESVLYPYGKEPEPIVDCQPLRTTDIELQPGETITDVAMGDTERWMATPAASGAPRDPVPHLAVKPQSPGIDTNLTIYTTRHIYHLFLRSRAGHAMQQVEFYYPDELLTAIKEADLANTKQEAADPPSDSDNVVKGASVEPAQLNFAYNVAGPNVPWKPVRAFDDSSHVYIQMPAGMKTSDAPALLVNAGSGTQMVNYRVRGNYYVVDRLFTEAILVSGVGRNQDRVTITYAGGSR